jgi:hypothetical protein
MQFTAVQLDGAYTWLCRRRRHFPSDADIWWFRRRYLDVRAELLQEINSGLYRFSPQQKIIKSGGEVIHLWGSQDVLVMKLLAGALQALLPLSSRCTHLKGHGGLKQSIVAVQQHLDDYQYACKTDVKGYYESIDQYLLMDMINDHIQDPDFRHYLYQVIRRCVGFGGEYRDIEGGISRGCPLSPILGALYLQALDEQFAEQDVFYIRYMDDILILTRTRWHNRRAVRQLNQYLGSLKLEKHPDKTFIGRIEKGFDFLGYHFSREPLRVAGKTREKHVLHIIRLYEQLRKKKATPEEVASTLGLYVKRWHCWTQAGLGSIPVPWLASQSHCTSYHKIAE